MIDRRYTRGKAACKSNHRSEETSLDAHVVDDVDVDVDAGADSVGSPKNA